MHVSTFGIMPPTIVPSSIKRRAVVRFMSLMTDPALSFTPATSVRRNRRVAPKRAGNRAGHRIGVDVVGFTILAGADGGDDRDEIGVFEGVDDLGVDHGRFADETEIDDLFDVAVRDRGECVAACAP